MEDQTQREKVLGTLGLYSTMRLGCFSVIKAAKHRNDLVPGVQPVHQRPYRAVPRARELELQEGKRMLRDVVIQHAKAMQASLVVLVQKRGDPRMQFCVEDITLNITVRNSYPLPRMDECINTQLDAKAFANWMPTVLQCIIRCLLVVGNNCPSLRSIVFYY